MNYTIPLINAESTQNLGKLLGQSLPVSSVLLLQGDLGAGKTTLVQGIGEGLGIKEAIVSPTFTLINEYTEGRLPLYHFDLYRLSVSQVENLYPEIYWEGVEVAPGITVIEWADRLPYKPIDYVHIQLIETPLHQREAKLTKIGAGHFSLALVENFK